MVNSVRCNHKEFKRILLAAVAAMGLLMLGSTSAMAKGIEGIFVSAESSGDHSSYPARNAFVSQYWISGTDEQWYTRDKFIQANLSEPYRPVSYTLDVTDVQTSRIPQTFRLKGWSEELQAWDTLDVQVGVAWGVGSWKKTFAVSTSRSYTKLRLDLLQPLEKQPFLNNPFTIWTLKFEDEDAPIIPNVDLVCAARNGLSGVAIASCEVESGNVANLFDGDLGANLTSDQADNGRWLANKSVGERSVTLTFEGAAGFPTGYGFRMMTGKDDDAGLLAKRRLPSDWKVYASPTDGTKGDDWILLDERSDVGLDGWATWLVTNANVAVLDVELPEEKKYCQAQRLKFVFDSSVEDENFVQLGEIVVRGAYPKGSGTADCYVVNAAVESVSSLNATVQVSVFTESGEVAPYDLFVDCVHEGRTNAVQVAASCTALGVRSYAVNRLKFGTDYVLQARLVNASGSLSRGPELVMRTEEEDVDVVFPEGFKKLEYVQSTEDGRQRIVLGAQPANFGLEVDCIFYNALAKGSTWNGTTNGYGLLYQAVNYAGSVFFVSTSTGMSGTYPSGLRFDPSTYDALLSAEVIGKRIQIAHRSDYTVTSEYGVQSGVRGASGAVSGIYLMGGSNPPPSENSVMRIYSVATYANATDSTPSHFYQPAQAADGTNGLLDVLDGNPETAWYPGVGESNLVAGAILPTVIGSFEAVVDACSRTRLKATLTRENVSQEDAIFVVWGMDCGRRDPSDWANQKALGRSFKVGEQTATVTLNGLTADDVYLRFYTEGGRWSQTIYLPDFERKSEGLAIIFQ